MPAATSKTELLDVYDRELAKLLKLIDPITETSACWSEDAVSIKAIMGHRIHWLDLFWHWYDTGKDGSPVETPAPGFKWNQLKAYNAPIYTAADQEDWAALKTRFDDTATHFRTRLDALSEDELYTQHRYAWLNDWTLGRWSESAGPSHFRSAAKVIRKIIKLNA